MDTIYIELPFMKTLTIFLDFDGTVVEHAFPEIYAANPGSIEVIRKLQNAGHTIILNTYRAELGNGYLEAAIEFLEEEERGLKPMHEISQFKINPKDWNLDAYISAGVMFIDDISEGIPLTPNRALSSGLMVDWKVLDKLFEEKGVYGESV